MGPCGAKDAVCTLAREGRGPGRNSPLKWEWAGPCPPRGARQWRAGRVAEDPRPPARPSPSGAPRQCVGCPSPPGSTGWARADLGGRARLTRSPAPPGRGGWPRGQEAESGRAPARPSGGGKSPEWGRAFPSPGPARGLPKPDCVQGSGTPVAAVVAGPGQGVRLLFRLLGGPGVVGPGIALSAAIFPHTFVTSPTER